MDCGRSFTGDRPPRYKVIPHRAWRRLRGYGHLGYRPPAPEVVVLREINGAMETGDVAA